MEHLSPSWGEFYAQSGNSGLPLGYICKAPIISLSWVNWAVRLRANSMRGRGATCTLGRKAEPAGCNVRLWTRPERIGGRRQMQPLDRKSFVPVRPLVAKALGGRSTTFVVLIPL